MHLRIYLWLSCVVLAGYVRAQEDGAFSSSTEEAAHLQNDGPSPGRDNVYIDDDGSGLAPDESSGSGWGAGPGPDDEDGRGGSGDSPDGDSDDEDYVPPTTTAAPTTAAPVPVDPFSINSLEPSGPDAFNPDQTFIQPESPFITDNPDTDLSPLPTNFDIVIPRILKPSEGVPDAAGGGAREDLPSRPETDISISGEDLNPDTDHEPAGSNVNAESRPADNVVFIMNAKPEDRATSFFAQPGILAAVIGGAVVGLLCAILVVMFIVYRMRKKDEGSYALDEPKRSPAAASYGKGHNNREFYA
ncbi:syndecan isoform X1 [Ostrinia nubilalis]|uniref:syndecan isoform X1 n=1 Tax=Ostrinia nubilalis TaxID=29057 RepID=UPI00308239A5